MSKANTTEDKIVQFLRKRDYVLVKELGQGACGKTVLLHDVQIDEHFVCKKYFPYSESHRQELFAILFGKSNFSTRFITKTSFEFSITICIQTSLQASF